MASEHEKDKQIGEDEEEEEEYVLLELDDYSRIPANAPYILSVSWFLSTSAALWYKGTLGSTVSLKLDAVALNFLP